MKTNNYGRLLSKNCVDKAVDYGLYLKSKLS